MDDEDLERYLYLSGWVVDSVNAVRDDFPRWRRTLQNKSVTTIPSPISTAASDVQAINLLNLMANQVSLNRNSTREHDLRDVSEIRPYKGS